MRNFVICIKFTNIITIKNSTFYTFSNVAKGLTNFRDYGEFY